MRMHGKICLVTGAGSGIGKRTAVLMASEGGRIGVLSRTREEVEAAAEEIRAAGGEAMPLCADVADARAMRRAVEELARGYGTIDVVFANAGVNGVWGPLEDIEEEEWDRTIAINLRGTFLTLKYSLPHLKRQGGAVVINSSINGTRVFSNSGATAYAATKAAQVAMMKMLALELAPAGVRVNAVCPGAIETQIEENTEERDRERIGVPVEFPEGWHPLRGAPGTAEHVARAVLFLCSDEAEHITGTELWIDGGESLIGITG
ncbi:MAG TPA: SDR family NAD(P)-dependent oxidoreductase [Longimicrobiaceae bacterium]|nr:SDR family NAD(P)-dependent oxidoreductase [Longimicrobiaceae bacterium]